MTTFSKPLYSEGSLEFETTGNTEVDIALQQVDSMSMDMINDMNNGLMELFMNLGM